MTGRLDGRVAVVTGAQQGIGKSIALAYAREGAAVVVNYLDDHDAGEAIVAEAEAAGAKAVAVAGDISRADDIEAMMAAADALGGIDVLANNAGVFPRVPLLEITEADWDAVLNVNLRGSFFCMQAAARRMVAAGKPGVIVNLSSASAFRSSPNGTHYASSKAGLVGMTRGASLELAGHGIRVNAIAPGLTDTAQPRFGMTEDEIAAVGEQIPLGGITMPDDVADLAVFLASEESSRITGQTLHINGGHYLY